MEMLVEWFVTAHECHLNKVQNAAVAYLTNLHQAQYLAEYGDGDVSASLNSREINFLASIEVATLSWCSAQVVVNGLFLTPVKR